MFRPIPHLSRQEAASNRHEQCLKLATNDLLLGWQGENAIEYSFVQVGNTHLERGQHARSICLYKTILAQVCLQVGAHEHFSVESLTIALGSAFPGLKVLVHRCCVLVSTDQ